MGFSIVIYNYQI